MNHSLDSAVFTCGPLLSEGEDATGHRHLLVKDPTRLGWKCGVAGCGFFKPAEELDAIRVQGE